MPSTIVDVLEKDLEASAVSKVPASSRAVRRLLLVGGHAHEPTSPEVRGPDAAIPVTNIADPDSEALSDTATDPDLSRDGVANVEMGGDESEVDDSSGDSVVGDRDAQDAAGDVPAADTAWDEVIVNRATRAGFASLDRVDLVSLF